MRPSQSWIEIVALDTPLAVALLPGAAVLLGLLHGGPMKTGPATLSAAGNAVAL